MIGGGNVAIDVARSAMREQQQKLMATASRLLPMN